MDDLTARPSEALRSAEQLPIRSDVNKSSEIEANWESGGPRILLGGQPLLELTPPPPPSPLHSPPRAGHSKGRLSLNERVTKPPAKQKLDLKHGRYNLANLDDTCTDPGVGRSNLRNMVSV
jgi:hypothetical protein